MRATARFLCLALLPLVTACSGGEGSSPTAPSTTPPATTRIIGVNGNLAFGDVPVGSQRDMTFTIANSGNATLTVSSLTVSGGLVSQSTASWTSGSIAAGGSQTVTVRFAPTNAGSYNGTVTVVADHTSGSNTLPISGNATGPAVAGTWSGRYVVDRCDGTGSVQDYFCSSRGFFPPGTDLPILLSLTQNGGSVSGSMSLGQVTGPVSGSVNANGTLVLQGGANSGTMSISLSSWTSTATAQSMTGNFSYNATFSGLPGVAVVMARLSGVTKR